MEGRRGNAAFRRDEGLTLIELLLVLVILGILITVALPSYVGMRDRAANTAAKSEIRAVAVAAEAYAIDNFGDKTDIDGKKSTTGYKGMTIDVLRDNYDASLAADLGFKGNPKNASFCIVYSSGSIRWSAAGPGINGDSYVDNAKCK
jgi:prepilin-type N-terminal cleavage/methylation domain-containing protein